MNSNSTPVEHTMDNLPLQKALQLPFSIWIVIGTANILASLWIILVLVIKKPMQKDPRYLTIQMTVFEIFGGIAIVLNGLYHVIKTSNNEPETNTQFNCFMIAGMLVFTVVTLNLFYSQLSFDRFYTAIFPTVYARRSQFYVYFISLPVWLSTLIFIGLCVTFASKETYTSICLVNQSMSALFFDIYKYFCLSNSILSLFVYCSIGVVLKWQSVHTAKSGGNIGDIKKRMNNKVMKSLATSAVVHVFTTILATFSTLILKTLELPNLNLYVPYFATLYFGNSIIALPIYLTFQRKFREGSTELAKSVVTCKTLFHNNTSVAAVTSTSGVKSDRHK